jgi:hypothetical protein
MSRRRVIAGNNRPKTELLLHLDGDSTDSSFYQRNIVIGAYFNIPRPKFGSGSIYITTLAHRSEIDGQWIKNLFSSGKYTVEMFMREYAETPTPLAGVCCWYFTDGTVFEVFIPQDRRIVVYNGSSLVGAYQLTDAFVKNYFHVALVSDKGLVSVYVNGNRVITNINAPVDKTVEVLSIFGRRQPYTGGTWDYDEARISRVARYKSNFTVPSAPFVPD